MDRVSSTGYQTIGGRRTWQDKNLGAGIQGTTFDQVWFAGVQESIIGVAEQSGITPADQTLGNADLQLTQAIRRIAAGNSNGGAPITATPGSPLTPDNAGLVVVNAVGGNISITLPLSNSANGQLLRYTFVRSDISANSVSISFGGGDTTLFGGLTGPFTLPALGILEMVGDGSTHWCFSQEPGFFYFGSGSANIPVPLGVSALIVSGTAGGGGGGYGIGANSGGGGGGCGGVTYRQSIAVTPGSSVPYSIGGGGAGATSGTTTGANGSATTLGTAGALLYLTPGSGGAGGTSGSPAAGGAAGSGGNTSGLAGLSGNVITISSSPFSIGAAGGGCRFGAGGAGGVGTNVGQAGQGRGAGGGGGSAGNNGGAGAPGELLVEFGGFHP